MLSVNPWIVERRNGLEMQWTSGDLSVLFDTNLTATGISCALTNVIYVYLSINTCINEMH